jgi:hypothetical protein
MLVDELDGKEEEVVLNGHKVLVIAPKERISYEEGLKRIKELLRV